MVILIAEDDADDRFLIQTAFDEKGYDDKLEFVENGVELLSYLNDAQISEKRDLMPRIILLDLNMPKKDGRQVLREIKQHQVFKKIPIVVFTTTKNEKEIIRCYELGANSYIVKPSTFDDLLSAVEQIHTYWLNIASVA
jgi:CheY-like chemotaxis protein